MPAPRKISKNNPRVARAAAEREEQEIPIGVTAEQGVPLSQRLRLPPNWKDVTSRELGKISAIVGAESFRK